MNDIYFYGIDFKKIDLYCKVKTVASFNKKRQYREISKVLLKINTEKYYKVDMIDFDSRLLRITVDCSLLTPEFNKYNKDRIDKYIESSEERIRITLSFDEVDFAYYFEGTKESQLEKVVI